MSIEEDIRRRAREEALLAILLDPAKLSKQAAREVSAGVKEGGADLIFVGGSVGAAFGLNDTIIGAKDGSDLPVILFPAAPAGMCAAIP